MIGEKSRLHSSERADVKGIESNRNLSVMAFHEKAGRSQVDCDFISFSRCFLSAVRRCRHASIRTLEERIVSLGACWASSIQPVLPSVWRPVVLLLKVEPGPGHWRSHRNSAWAFVFSLPGTVLTLFLFTRLLQGSFDCYCATARTLLRSPTDDAATPPAFLPWPRWLVSCHSAHRARPALIPSV
jgi:hypothetical protein